MKVIDIFNQLQNTSEKKEKINIIKNNANDIIFIESLKFLLDTNITTGIAKKKYDKLDFLPISTTSVESMSYLDLLDYIKQNNTGRDEDIFIIKRWCYNKSKDIQEFIRGMATKSIKLGCDYKTVNLAIPNLINKWEVQLGSSYDKLKLKDGEKFWLSQKLNGNRGSYYNGKIISRQGKEFTGLSHIIKDLESLDPTLFYDGELIRKNVDNLSDGENFRIGTGILNSDAISKEEIKFVIFDCFPASELDNKKSKENYSSRYNKLNELRDIISSKKLNNVEVVNMFYFGYDQNKIMEWLDFAVEHDMEGCMLNKDAPYECKRTSNLIKIKRFYTLDLPVIEILEGDGRLKGTLGALVVKYKDNTVNVGSGYDDNTRKYIWENKDSILGRIIEVKYKEITKDKKTGLESLQFPIYVGLREKGKEVSYD